MNILFIGNSYTFYNDMPFLLKSLLRENGIDADIDAVTKGGRKLMENLAEDDERGKRIRSLVSSTRYDVLFLQEQSFFPIVGYDSFVKGAGALKDMAGAKRTLLYSTWGRKEGCELLEEKGWTSEQMYDLLTEAYRGAANAIGADISPAGRVFAKISEKDPEIELYSPDRSHPSYTGSCAVAVTHFKSITGRLPERADSLGLSAAVLDVILSAADSITE